MNATPAMRPESTGRPATYRAPKPPKACFSCGTTKGVDGYRRNGSLKTGKQVTTAVVLALEQACRPCARELDWL